MKMAITEILNRDAIILDLSVRDRFDAIRELVAVLVETGVLKEELHEAVVNEIMEREQILGTGMEHGVAVPHACISGIGAEMAAFARAHPALDFGAEDRTPSDLIFLLLIPCETMSAHVRRLSEIVKVLNVERNRDAIREAESGEEIYQVFADNPS